MCFVEGCHFMTTCLYPTKNRLQHRISVQDLNNTFKQFLTICKQIVKNSWKQLKTVKTHCKHTVRTRKRWKKSCEHRATYGFKTFFTRCLQCFGEILQERLEGFRKVSKGFSEWVCRFATFLTINFRVFEDVLLVLGRFVLGVRSCLQSVPFDGPYKLFGRCWSESQRYCTGLHNVFGYCRMLMNECLNSFLHSFLSGVSSVDGVFFVNTFWYDFQVL